MKITLLVFGKTNQVFVSEGMEYYLKKITPFYDLKIEVIDEPKNYSKLDVLKQKSEEAKLFKARLNSFDEVVLLDEHGIEMTSQNMAKKFELMFNSSKKRIVFIIGGAYGFSDEMHSLYKNKISLSKLTFTHQMVRLIFVEQFYRVTTIIKGMPYHHQ